MVYSCRTTGLQELWEDGLAFRELTMRGQELTEQREAIEAERKVTLSFSCYHSGFFAETSTLSYRASVLIVGEGLEDCSTLVIDSIGWDEGFGLCTGMRSRGPAIISPVNQ